MTIALSTTIDIDAAKHTVWDVLTDFAHYGEWNPFVKAEGTARVGTKLVMHMSADGGRGLTFKPTVLVAAPGKELRWVGKLGASWLLYGEHFFILASNTDGTTRFTNGENFSGALVTLTHRILRSKNNDTGYDAFNKAIKQRAETVAKQ